MGRNGIIALGRVLLVLGLVLIGVCAARIQDQIWADLAIQHFEAVPLESAQNVDVSL